MAILVHADVVVADVVAVVAGEMLAIQPRIAMSIPMKFWMRAKFLKMAKIHKHQLHVAVVAVAQKVMA
jgi:hypothetical protein